MNKKVIANHRVVVCAALVLLCLVMVQCVFAQGLYGFGLTETDLDELGPELSSHVREALDSARSVEEQRAALDHVLDELVLPEQFVRRLTIKRAEVSASGTEVVSIYESLLNNEHDLQDSAIRGRIISMMLSTDEFGSELEKLERLDALMSPVLALPMDRYDTRSIGAVALYADAVRTLGYSAASPLLDPRVVEGDQADRQVLNAQVSLYHAQKAHTLLSGLLEVVQARFDSRGPDGVPRDSSGRLLEDSLANQLASLQHYVSQADTVILLSQGHLEEHGATPDEKAALEAIETYLVGYDRDALPRFEPKSESKPSSGSGPSAEEKMEGSLQQIRADQKNQAEAGAKVSLARKEERALAEGSQQAKDVGGKGTVPLVSPSIKETNTDRSGVRLWYFSVPAAVLVVVLIRLTLKR